MDKVITIMLDPVAALNFSLTLGEAMDYTDIVCEDDTIVFTISKGNDKHESYTELTINTYLMMDLGYYNKINTLYSVDCISYN